MSSDTQMQSRIYRSGKHYSKSVLLMSFNEILELYKKQVGKEKLTEAEENYVFINWLRFHFGLSSS